MRDASKLADQTASTSSSSTSVSHFPHLEHINAGLLLSCCLCPFCCKKAYISEGIEHGILKLKLCYH